MKAALPYVEVPGDNAQRQPVGMGVAWVHERIMARSGALVGMDDRLAVWRFGFLAHSEAANAYGVALNFGYGFVWVLATRRTGKVKETSRGIAKNLPPHWQKVIDG